MSEKNIESDFECFTMTLALVDKYFPYCHKKGLERPIAMMTVKRFQDFVKYCPKIFINNNTQIKLEHPDHNVTIFDIQFYRNPFEEMSEEEFKDWFENNTRAGKTFLSSRGCGKTETISSLWPNQPRNVITGEKNNEKDNQHN